MKKKIIIAVIAAGYIALGWLCFGGSGHRSLAPSHSPEYARGVNDALDSCSMVIRDRKERRERMPNYQEMGREVCGRLNVKRDEWFMRVVASK